MYACFASQCAWDFFYRKIIPSSTQLPRGTQGGSLDKKEIKKSWLCGLQKLVPPSHTLKVRLFASFCKCIHFETNFDDQIIHFIRSSVSINFEVWFREQFVSLRFVIRIRHYYRHLIYSNFKFSYIPALHCYSFLISYILALTLL